MSSRNIRKLTGGNILPPPEDEDSDDYEPLYVKKITSKNIYEALVASSHSESEGPNVSDDEVDETEAVQFDGEKKKKKKRKQKKHKQTVKQTTEDNIQLDEIEQSLREVNEMLGTPIPTSNSDDVNNQTNNQTNNLMLIRNKNLSYTYEEFRVFGPGENVQANRRRGRQPNLERIVKRGLIVPGEYFENFTKIGLTMFIEERKNGITYFAFNHSQEYQIKHRILLENILLSKLHMVYAIDDVMEISYPEAMIEMADVLLEIEDSSGARKLIEKAIAYMQYVSHPSFRLSDPAIRLEYKYVENRMFHVAVLKYIHMLTNIMCHRTALELAKLLLNLDPSDPLGVVFIIDTLALRAREHQWLIDIIDLWKKERQADFLVNIQYSYAMAHFHVASKRKDDLSRANELLQSAMLNFPTVVPKLLECMNTQEPQIQSHHLFTYIERSNSLCLLYSIMLYAKFTAARWREPEVLDWFLTNAKDLVNKYNNDTTVQIRASEAAVRRKSLFPIWPDELIRHMVVIKRMGLLINGTIPNLGKDGTSANPLPVPIGNGINRYKYDYKKPVPQNEHLLDNFILFIAPAFRPPHYRQPDPDDIVAQAEARNARAAQRRDRDQPDPDGVP